MWDAQVLFDDGSLGRKDDAVRLIGTLGNLTIPLIQVATRPGLVVCSPERFAIALPRPMLARNLASPHLQI